MFRPEETDADLWLRIQDEAKLEQVIGALRAPVNDTNGRAFGPEEQYKHQFPGRWPGLGKPMARWAE